MSTIEDMLFSIERQRAGRAVDGKIPDILEAQADLAEDGDDVIVLVELSDGCCIAAGFSLSSIVGPDEKAVIDLWRALLTKFRKARVDEVFNAAVDALNAEAAR